MKTYINKSIPSLVEVALGDDAYGLTYLNLDSARHRCHQAYYLLLDRGHLIFRELVLAIFVCPIPLDEVLEVEGTCEASIQMVGFGGSYLK